MAECHEAGDHGSRRGARIAGHNLLRHRAQVDAVQKLRKLLALLIECFQLGR
jgi:hypothetical protein